MKVTVILVVIGALGTVIKGLVQRLEDLEIRGRVETTPTIALLTLTRILRRILETWGDLLSLMLQWETPVWKSQKEVTIIKKWIINRMNLSENSYILLTLSFALYGKFCHWTHLNNPSPSLSISLSLSLSLSLSSSLSLSFFLSFYLSLFLSFFFSLSGAFRKCYLQTIRLQIICIYVWINIIWH